MARPRVPTTWRPVSSRPSWHPSSGSWSTPTGPSSGAPRRRRTGGTHTYGSAPRYRALLEWGTTAPFRHPHSAQRRPARAHAVGSVLDPQGPLQPQPGHTGHGTPAARPRGRTAGGGTAPDTRRPSQRWQATPPGDCPPPPPRHTAPTGRASQGDRPGLPHPHTRTHSTWVADPDSPPERRVVGGGGAPDLRRPSQWRTAPPPGDTLPPPPQRATLAGKGARAVGPLLGPHARTDSTRDTRVAEPRLPAPEDGRPGKGQRLTPDAPHNGGRPPPRGRPPTTPAARSPHRACKARRQC